MSEDARRGLARERRADGGSTPRNAAHRASPDAGKRRGHRRRVGESDNQLASSTRFRLAVGARARARACRGGASIKTRRWEALRSCSLPSSPRDPTEGPRPQLTTRGLGAVRRMRCGARLFREEMSSRQQVDGAAESNPKNRTAGGYVTSTSTSIGGEEASSTPQEASRSLL